MMETRNVILSRVQWVMQDYDLVNCKMVAKWLAMHIKLRETDFTDIKANIEDIGLSNRAKNVLKTNGILTMQELLILVSNRYSIQFLKGAGTAVTREIEKKVLTFQHSIIFKPKKQKAH
jgi:DNA-directed RNA polymerase alpha subunit